MDTLLNLETVSSHNLKGLRHLFDKVETRVRGLMSLGIPPSSYISLLSSILMSKLPQDLRLVVSRSVTDSDSLMNVIDEEIYTRERAVTMLTPPHRQCRDIPTAAVLMTSDTTQGCSYCHQNH